VLAVLAALLAMARPAAADPGEPRVLTAPTAWLPEAGGLAATLGVDHRGDGTLIAVAGLGGLAAVELGADTDVRAALSQGARPTPVWLGRAAFRLGARQDAWFPGMPAIVVGVRATFAARGHAVHAPRASDGYLVASRDLGVIRLHAGADAISASVDGQRAPARLRPLAGLELHPPRYPRSTLMADLAWAPALELAGSPTLRWLLGVGVRYQAFGWASVELAVRVREAEDLGATTVMVRVNAALPRQPR
jgi:hypothetical protein